MHTTVSLKLTQIQVEDISNLLNTGEVPNLFDTGEVIAIGEAVRNRAKVARMDGSRADLFAFFVAEVRGGGLFAVIQTAATCPYVFLLSPYNMSRLIAAWCSMRHQVARPWKPSPTPTTTFIPAHPTNTAAPTALSSLPLCFPQPPLPGHRSFFMFHASGLTLPFAPQVRRYLHCVLAFSPVGDAFRERLRKFPSLVTCTTIDWFTAWPDDALRSVAHSAVRVLPFAVAAASFFD